MIDSRMSRRVKRLETVVISGPRAAVLIDEGIRLVDVADTSAPAERSRLHEAFWGGSPGQIMLAGDRLYTASGGCVYDGVALQGARVRVGDDGRVALGGDTIAKGYRNPTDPDPFAEAIR